MEEHIPPPSPEPSPDSFPPVAPAPETGPGPEAEPAPPAGATPAPDNPHQAAPTPAPVSASDPTPARTPDPAPAPASAPAVASTPDEPSPATLSVPDLHTSGPAFGIGSIIVHPSFGRGRIQSYDGRAYVILFKGGDMRTVSFDFAGMKAEERVGDPNLDLVKQAVQEVLSDYGWIDSSIELGTRWQGGAVVLEPGITGTQAKEIPMDIFFKKIIGIREKLRVLEQKINNHKNLSEEEKVELEGYITRCYGSLTTFNSLFADKSSYFKGSGKK